MAITCGRDSESTWDIVLDNSYATGGYSMAPSITGFSSIISVVCHGLFRNGANAVWGSYDAATNKLFCFWGNAGTASVTPEVTNGQSLASYVGRVTIRGVRG